MKISKLFFVRMYRLVFGKPLLISLVISVLCFVMLGASGKIKTRPAAKNYMERRLKAFKNSETIRDIDGNIYHSVSIGRQVWMIENLRTGHYNDSTEIPEVKKQKAWDDLKTGACCSYKNNSENDESYGKFYNWYAIKRGKLCPPGWHVPTRQEWKILVDFLGGDSLAGAALQVYNSKHTLVSIETGLPLEFNSSGFKALAAGKRGTDFMRQGQDAWFWTSSEFCWKSGECNGAHYVTMSFPDLKVELNEVGAKDNGFSVRCIKD